MGPITIEVDIEHGTLVARQPHLLPEKGVGIMTVISQGETSPPPRSRASLPLVRCAPGTRINPTVEELDASLWD